MSRLKVFAILECLLCRCDWQISCNAVIAVIDICTECDHELYGVPCSAARIFERRITIIIFSLKYKYA